MTPVSTLAPKWVTSVVYSETSVRLSLTNISSLPSAWSSTSATSSMLRRKSSCHGIFSSCATIEGSLRSQTTSSISMSHSSSPILSSSRCQSTPQVVEYMMKCGPQRICYSNPTVDSIDWILDGGSAKAGRKMLKARKASMRPSYLRWSTEWARCVRSAIGLKSVTVASSYLMMHQYLKKSSYPRCS